jgi:acetyl esterase/lipase
MGRALRGLVIFLTGALSAFLGVSITLPSVWSFGKYVRIGIALSELPWIPFVLGVVAIRGSRGNRWKLGGWLGLIGASLSLRPLFHLNQAHQRHEQAMREGLGMDYRQQIAPELRPLLMQTRLNIPVTAAQRLQSVTRARITRNVVYSRVDGVELHGDIYSPLAGKPPYPAILSVHGGGWESGTKGEFFTAHCCWLAQQGYLVFDINYRLSPMVMWPGHLSDVKHAIRWLRANAEKFQIDPARIGIVGRSAGAHLALMAAFTGNDPTFPEREGLPLQDQVQAVVAIYPPTDMDLLQATVVRDLAYWLGVSQTADPDFYTQASPLHRAHEAAPPVLLAHGGFDNLVVPEHSARLHQRLRELGVPSVYLHYPWGRHGFDYTLAGLGGHMLQYDMDHFLAWALRPEKRNTNA